MTSSCVQIEENVSSLELDYPCFFVDGFKMENSAACLPGSSRAIGKIWILF